ncbi:MAG TPA: CHAT domain-containing protein, partial [Kofleriaceae bacterium]
AMRRALGTGFSIQFLTDEPHIPWELMRPVVDDEARDLLGVTHPVARGLQAYPDRLRPALPATGEILTIAPDYGRPPGRGLPALPGARHESAMLQQRFAAVAIRSTARGLLEAFQDRRGVAVRLVHFAGHGKSEVPVDRSRIACEDDDVSVAQLRNAENRLGENYGTFVVLNACESGAAGDALADVGGWGEAFAYRKFSGMIAPLWAVLDRDATAAMERLFTALLHDRTPVGEALRDMRAELGSLSPTYLSYVYYGDVHARFT